MTWAILFGYSLCRQLSARPAKRAAARGSRGCVAGAAWAGGAVALGSWGCVVGAGAAWAGDAAVEVAGCVAAPGVAASAPEPIVVAIRANPMRSGVRRLSFGCLPTATKLKIIHLSPW